MLHSILHLKHQLPIEISFSHVKGHQDNKSPISLLSWQAQLNLLVDKLAKDSLHQALQTSTQHNTHTLPFIKCKISYTNKYGNTFQIRNKLTNSLRYYIHKDQARAYWVRKKSFENTENNISWNLCSRSLLNSPIHETRWLCKFSSGFCGVGKLLKCYKYQIHDHCP